MVSESDQALESIDSELRKAAKILDQVAYQLRDANFDSSRNIQRIGKALVEVFAIQNDIYRVRPDLMPDFLKKGR